MEMKPLVTIDQYAAMDIRVGTIQEVHLVEGSEKLVRCMVDFGPELATHTITLADGTELPVRQILSGIRAYYPDPTVLVGMQALYIVNLAPRTMMGYDSNGMLLAVGDNDCIFMVPQRPVAAGSPLH